jgi:serine/threonine protein kinase
VLVRAKPNAAATTLEDFDLQLQLGRGTFGKVFLAEHKKTKVLYAIKVIRKDVLIEYD